MKTIKRQFGDFGERIACRYLVSCGFNILDKNFYTKYGEIDIIASKNNEIFFIEVKTRTKYVTIYYPENAISVDKMNKMDMAAQIYLNKKRIYKVFYSFSCLAIIIDKQNKKANIKFFEKI